MMSNSDPEPQPVDKKCRLCGFADADNTNIFHATHSVLLAKILAVYPLILYQDDPLPKSICRKCVNNVNVMYADIQRVMKNQSKWISNVRSVQPDHNYIKLLDLIENSNTVTRSSIKIALGVDICSQSINRSLFVDKAPLAPPKKVVSSPPKGIASLKSNPSNPSSAKANAPNAHSTQPANKSNPSAGKSSEIKNLKTILELNGCSLLTVASKNEEQKAPKEHLGTENIANVDEPALSKSSFKRPRITSDEAAVRCRYCNQQFSTVTSLAMHQVIHLRIGVSNIYEKKMLPKKLRKGRLITPNNQKCIRCLNCWCVFPDSPSILEHWAQAMCGFYCQLCGQEFPQSPKSLRSHVLSVHKITYRSLRAHRPLASTPAKDVKIKPITLAKTVATTTQSEDIAPLMYRVVQKQQPSNNLKALPQKQETLNHTVLPVEVKQEPLEEHANEDPMNTLIITEIKQEPWDKPSAATLELPKDNSQLRMQLVKTSQVQPDKAKLVQVALPAHPNNVGQVQGASPAQPDHPRVVAPRLEALLRDPPKPPPPMASVHSILRTYARTAPVIVRAISQPAAPKPPDAVSKPEALEGESCQICGFVFKNIAQRIAHSHMHQKQAAAANNNKTTYQCPPTVMSYAPSSHPTFRIQPVSGPVVCKPQPVAVPAGITTASVLRGVRTKFVDRRKDGASPSTGGIKVKSLTDLRNAPTTESPSVNNQSTARKSWVIVPREPPPPKIEDDRTDLEHAQTNASPEQSGATNIVALVCGNCHLHFPTRLEFFRHKRNCQAITCEYCKASFAQKYEYQLHVMQTHNSSISFNVKTKNS